MEESTHAVLACDLCGLWEVIYFLVFLQTLICLAFNTATSPDNSEILFPLSGFSEPIVLQEGPDESGLDAVVHLEVVAAVGGLVRTDAYWVYVGSET